jgi:Flp pilus assembly protein TadG
LYSYESLPGEVEMRHLRFRDKHSCGQALVEFALLAPLLILIVMGIIEFGRLWMTMTALSGAAWQGVRVAAVTAPDQGLVEDAANHVLNAAGLDAATITITGPDPDSQNEVRVRVEITYSVLTGSIIPGLGDTIQLARTAVMRWEG